MYLNIRLELKKVGSKYFMKINSILYIEGEKCMIFPKVQFVARGRSPRATKHRGKNEHSLQKYICYGQRR
jgi:hypothetical protein